jgi:hypothetical protein
MAALASGACWDPRTAFAPRAPIHVGEQGWPPRCQSRPPQLACGWVITLLQHCAACQTVTGVAGRAGHDKLLVILPWLAELEVKVSQPRGAW